MVLVARVSRLLSQAHRLLTRAVAAAVALVKIWASLLLEQEAQVAVVRAVQRQQVQQVQRIAAAAAAVLVVITI
jgi:hypothetical protein